MTNSLPHRVFAAHRHDAQMAPFRVISDWKFFLDNEDWLNLWARRSGESAVHALAEELRGLPWRAKRDQSEKGLARE